MKDIQTVLYRTILLRLFTERCFLEDDGYYSGLSLLVEERNEYRKRGFAWIEKNGLLPFLTEEETLVFQTPIEETPNQDIYSLFSIQEAIEPLLWSIGLKDKISNYLTFSQTDWNEIFPFTETRWVQTLLEHATYRKKEDILLARDVARCWQWRCAAGKNTSFFEQNAEQFLASHFGPSIEPTLSYMKTMHSFDHLFTFQGKPCFSLTDIEWEQIATIAYWRSYAFEWMTSDKNWDQ